MGLFKTIAFAFSTAMKNVESMAGVNIWEMRASLNEARASYAAMAGHIVRMRGALKDHTKSRDYYQRVAKALLESGDEAKAREAAKRVVEYNKLIEEAENVIKENKEQMSEIKLSISELSTRLNAATARMESANARKKTSGLKVMLDEHETEYRILDEQARMAEELAGLSDKGFDPVFEDVELEVDCQEEEDIDEVLNNLRAPTNS